ncbi:MAG: glutamate--cysteine ligase [Gammaproteobacteria bacterium CG11_big_fil_rev_8_21_14_0_20_46_22]|nr:MAG: glutamate--cysteine ligase [Gammaproteobacteria bacterium CG12_big_fil_rev_8_21_14_0_65_46_12]PIR10846.1 MAG: glutamate--cysteine ligase [Gammaproteobacteria bacterium CG11_big_fil_rev_8_21_14_0_20_46_22]
MASKPYSLFSVYGIEIEYMIVDVEHLNVLPICDKLLLKLAGKMENEVELGRVAVSNELALHVVEIKTNGPRASLSGLSGDFHETVKTLQACLREEGACLMPTGMHPWFDPEAGFCLWPHGDKTIYNTYHKIFNCSGHGWSNLQSTHINLPFANDEEFSVLHAAIRLVLPLIPALAASTPFKQAKLSGVKDTRLEFYGKNQKAIPAIAGEVIPESVHSKDQYQADILMPMYEAISSHDPNKVLQYEWLNSRGAIARFDRNAIEIRIMDSQECPLADIACANFIAELVRDLASSVSAERMSEVALPDLKAMYLGAIEQGMHYEINHATYLEVLGCEVKASSTNAVLKALFEKISGKIHEEYRDAIAHTLSEGNLSERLLRAYDKSGANEAAMFDVYRQLCDCLRSNELFYV